MDRDSFNRLWKYSPLQREEELWPFINDILNTHNIKSVLEIGVGGSSSFWCHFCKNGGFYIGVDLDTEQGESNVLREYGPDFPAYFIKGDSRDVETTEKVRAIISIERPVDFLFIDGDHFSKNVYLDIKNYYPFLRSGGVLGMHDYIQGGESRGIYKAVKDSKLEGIIEYSSRGLYACKRSMRSRVKSIYYCIKR